MTAIYNRNDLINVDFPRGIANSPEQPFQGIELIVSRSGEYFVNGEAVRHNSDVNLASQLRQASQGDTNLPVILYADGELSHRTVVNIMGIIENTGFTQLQLALDFE